MKYKRIVLKISGEGFRNKNETRSYNVRAVAKRAEEIKFVQSEGVEIIIVPGAGNLVKGKDISNILRADADDMGMIATMANVLYLQKALERNGVEVRRFSAIEVGATPMYMREKALTYLKEGRVVILGGGIGLPYHTTDYTAVIRALELNADAILKGAKVEGIYEKYPPVTRAEKPIPELSYESALKLNTGEMFDGEALQKLKSQKSNMPVHIFSIFEKENLLKILRGEKIGTIILPQLPQ